MLRALDLAPVLDCVLSGPREVEDSPVPTHVYSFHADSATVPADTWLCSYNEAATEGLRNDQAMRRVDVPETRAALLKLHGGLDDESFQEFLHENHIPYFAFRQAVPGKATGAHIHLGPMSTHFKLGG